MLQTGRGGLTSMWLAQDGRMVSGSMQITTSSGENNNVSITDSLIYVSTSNDLDSITGMNNAGTDGTLLLVINTSLTNNLVLKNNSSSSQSQNRISSPTGSDLIVPPSGTVMVGYDAANLVWRIITMPDSLASGTIHMWGGATAPANWLLCDGSAVSRTTYAGIFAAISTVYGTGNGTTTFNLPDLRQRFPLGKSTSGTGVTLGGTGGLIDHLHTVDPPSTTSGTPSATTIGISLIGAGTAGSGTHTHDLDIAQFNSGTANPPFQVVNFIIKI